MQGSQLALSTSAPARQPSATFRVGRAPHLWQAVHQEGVNVVQERRVVSADVLACARLAADNEREAAEITIRSGEHTPAAVFRHLPDHPGRAALEDDVRALITRFCALAPFGSVRAKLHAVHHGQCRKFHADYVGLRLLCTYAGPGTEWVPDEAVAREELGIYDEDIDAANDRIVPDRTRVRRADIGDALLLRGNAWRAGARGAVHRSPSVDDCANHRLVLVVTGMT